MTCFISLEPLWDGYTNYIFPHLHYTQVIPFYCCQILFTCHQMQCATNSPGDQSKHKISAVATPACSLPHQSPSMQNSPFRRGAAECPAHSVLDLVSVWTPAAGFAVHTFNCPERGSDHQATCRKR